MSQQGDAFKLSGAVLDNSYDGRDGNYYNQNLSILDDALYVHMLITSLQGAKQPHSTKRTYQALPLLAHIYYSIILTTKTERYRQTLSVAVDRIGRSQTRQILETSPTQETGEFAEKEI